MKKIGDRAFYNCQNLDSIKLSHGLEYIGDEAFYATAYYNDGDNWEEEILYIDEYLICATTDLADDFSIKSGTRLIASYAFFYCTFTSIEIPNSVKIIGDSAFYACEYLTSVTIPSSVTYIGGFAFYCCSNIMSITIPSSVSYVGYCAFGYDSDDEKIKSFTVTGQKGSVAKEYAIEHGFEFIELDISIPADSDYYLDTQTNTMPNLVAKTTVDALISALSEYGVSATVTDKNGVALDSSAFVGTGCKVVCEKGEFTVIVKGDVDGSGEVDAADYLKVKGSLHGQATLTDEFALAADADGNNELTSTDYLKIKAFFLGTFDLFA